MDRLGTQLRGMLAAAVRDASHTHNPAYGRALVIEEFLRVVEGELSNPKYSASERNSVRQITLEAMNHGRRMVP